jgi:hypothetical protein
MDTTRRGFLGALVAAFALPFAKLLRTAPVRSIRLYVGKRWTIRARDVMRWPTPTALKSAEVPTPWTNIQSATPLTERELREAIALLETIPADRETSR